jgi:uncharacterized protein DUF2380
MADPPFIPSGPRDRANNRDSSDHGVADGAEFGFILRWSAPPDKPGAAATRTGAKPMTGPKVKSACETAADARCRWREGVLARGRAWFAALGFAAFLVLTSVAIAGCSAAAAPPLSEPVKTVALLSVQFLNDHEDLEPTTVEERARLASIEELFKSELEASGRYRFVTIPADAAAKIAAGPEIGNCGGCEFDYGRRLGGDFAAWIVVQKVSDLILNINVYMADVAAKELKFVRSVDIRGNSDESWTRGITYLVKNYLLTSR